jgi:membrane carboxypeptidase/penicillin-binding protein
VKRFTRWALATVLVLVAAVASFFATLPNVAALARRDPATTAFIERRKAELRREGRSDRIDRIAVPLSRIAPALKRAVVLTEDQNFFRHHGVDWAATKLAIRTDIDTRRLRLGGSTITQQLAKNLYLSPARTPWRKAREIAIAIEMERLLPKDRILELYLNPLLLRAFGGDADESGSRDPRRHDRLPPRLRSRPAFPSSRAAGDAHPPPDGKVSRGRFPGLVRFLLHLRPVSAPGI